MESTNPHVPFGVIFFDEAKRAIVHRSATNSPTDSKTISNISMTHECTDTRFRCHHSSMGKCVYVCVPSDEAIVRIEISLRVSNSDPVGHERAETVARFTSQDEDTIIEAGGGIVGLEHIKKGNIRNCSWCGGARLEKTD